MSDSIYRFPLKLKPSNPRDAAIIGVLASLTDDRRASHAVRDALYQVLVLGAAAPAPVAASLASVVPAPVRAVRSARSAAPVPVSMASVSDVSAVDSAFDALLEAF